MQLVEVKPRPSGELKVWPSREEWSKERRTPYYDRFEDLPVSNLLADYADEATVAKATTELAQLWRDLGRDMRASADAERREALRYERQCIKLALKSIRRGDIPSEIYRRGIPPEVLAPFDAPKAAAHKAAEEQRHREIAATPIDNSAWRQELRRRVRLDEHFGRTSSAAEELRQLETTDLQGLESERSSWPRSTAGPVSDTPTDTEASR